MRKIEFRGKVIGLENQMVYGSLIIRNVYGVKHYLIEEFETGKEYLVYKDTIGQNSGVPDEKGKEIFEGDVLEHEISTGEKIYLKVVVTEDKENGHLFKTRYLNDRPYNFLRSVKCISVIGNIHEEEI